jgi:DNA-binding beta-propeller fold protein YncE
LVRSRLNNWRRAWGLAAFAIALLAAFAPAASAAPTVYVANAFTNDVSAYSVGPSGGLAPVPGAPFEAGIAPVGVAISPGGERLYVTNSESKTLSVLTIGAGGALSPAPGSPYPTRTWPWGVAASPDGAHVYVANSGADSVSAYSVTPDGGLSPVPGSPFSTVGPTVGLKSNGIAITPDGAHLYVTNMNGGGKGGNVSAFSIQPDGGLSPVPGSPFYTDGETSRSASVAPDGRHLFVGNASSYDISVFAIGADGALAPVPGSPFPTEAAVLGVAVSPDGGHLYAAHVGGAANIWGYSVGGDGALSAMPGLPFPTGGYRGNSIALSPDGKSLYSTNSGSHDLSAYSAAASGALSLMPGSPFETGRGPLQVAVTPDQGPAAAFSAEPGLAGNASSFDASASSDPDGAVASYRWDFGDGQSETTTSATASHRYASPGEYAVTLTATDDAGCSTAQAFTGQTASCNGSSLAQATHEVEVQPGAPLGVSLDGPGSGSVTSSPAGVSCPGACSHAYSPGTPVTLTASPAPGSELTGWSGGGCSGTGSCEATVAAATEIAASFGEAPPLPSPIGFAPPLAPRPEPVKPLEAGLRIDRARPKPTPRRLTVVVSGAIAGEARGVVLVKARGRLGGRSVAAARPALIRDGRWQARFALPRPAPRSQLALEVSGRFDGSPGVSGGSASRRVSVVW